jgi:hypothetical protein
MIYAGATLLIRRRASQRSAEELIQQEAEADRKVLSNLGDGKLKILMFYANPPAISHGAKMLLCYGVAGAKSVRIEPGVEAIRPSLSRCLEVYPKASVTYTLSATDADGKTDTSAIQVQVQ